MILDVDYVLNLIILKMLATAIHSKQSSESVIYSELLKLRICIYCNRDAAVVSEEFIIISHLFCLPNYLINSVVLIVVFTVCFVEA